MKQIKIAITDDCIEDAKILESYCNSYFTNKNICYTCTLQHALPSSLDYFHAFDLIFLDVAVEDQIAISAVLQWQNNHILQVPVILVSRLTAYAIDGYKIGALRFLQKPIDPASFQQMMDEIFQNEFLAWQKIYDPQIMEIPFSVKDILYVESWSKKSKIHFIQGLEIIAPYTLQKWETILPSRSFAFSHRTLIVNFHYISGINHLEVHLTNGENLPVSRYKEKEFKQKWLEYRLQHHTRF